MTEKGVIYYIETRGKTYRYIGQAINYRERMTRHQYGDLKIDEAIRKYGYDSFILEECPIEDLDQREAYYIDLFHTYEWDLLDGLNQNMGHIYNSHYIVHYDWKTFQFLGIYKGYQETYRAVGSPPPHYMKDVLARKYNTYGLMYLDDYIFLDSYRNRQTQEYKDWLIEREELKKIHPPTELEREQAGEKEYQRILSEQKPTYTDPAENLTPGVRRKKER